MGVSVISYGGVGYSDLSNMDIENYNLFIKKTREMIDEMEKKKSSSSQEMNDE